MTGLLLTTWRGPALLAAAVVVLYLPALDNGFHYDDTHSLVDNTSVRTLANLGRFFVDPGMFSAMPEARMYRPLVLVTYAVNHALGGYDPAGYHLLNVLLHAVNVCLVWALARRCLGSPASAATAALLFALHPLVSEPVNYVSNRSTSMAALFVLAAMVLLIDAARRPTWRSHAALAGLMTAALMSKSVGIVLLPAAFLWLWVLGPGTRAAWSLLAAPAVAGVAYIAGTRAIVGKAMLEPVRSLASQAGTQLKAIPFYAYKNLVPIHQSIEPGFREEPGLVGLVPLVSLLLILCFAGAVLVLRRLCPAAAFGAAWFAVTLSPSSVVPLNVLVNEHRLYLPLVGGTILAAALLGAAGRRLRFVLPVLLALWAVLVWQRGHDWQSEVTIWGDAARKGPGMPRIFVNLGKGYLEEGNYEEAIAASRRALALDPEVPMAHYNIGTSYLHMGRHEEAIASFEAALEADPVMLEALNNLSNAHQHLGEYDRAIDVLREALRLRDWGQLHHNLGAAWLAAGEPDSAAAAFRRADERGDGDRETFEGWGRALLQADRLQESLRVLDRGLRETPGDREMLHLRGYVLVGLGQDREALATYRRSGLSAAQARQRVGDAARERQAWERARTHYEAGLAEAPEEARLLDGLGMVHVAEGDYQGGLALFRRAAAADDSLAGPLRNIGLVNLRFGRTAEAIAALERARDLDPEDGRTWDLLARALAQSGRSDRAVAAYQRALRLEPGRADLYHNLATLHERRGELREAERLYREALRRDPTQAEPRYNLGYLQLEQRRWAEAAATLEDLLRRHPGQALAYVNLASAYLNLGQGERAAGAYERFLQLYTTDDETRRKVAQQLALLRERLGAAAD